MRFAYFPLRPALLAGLLATLAAGAAQAVTIAPGGAVAVQDSFLGTLVLPGTSLAADASLAGEVVAQATRPFTIDVASWLYASADPPTHATVSGTVRDWVVRRADTGTLDFYAAIEPSAFGFAGALTRPWQLGAAAGVEAGFRDDAPGNAPSWLSVAASGDAVSATYFATDEGVPNWLSDTAPAAPVLFRSTATRFAEAAGALHYDYGAVYMAASGYSAINLFAPAAVPEPASAVVLGSGLLVLGALRARRRYSAFSKHTQPGSLT